MRHILAVLLLLLPASTPAQTQLPTHEGTLEISKGDTWTDYTAADFTTQTSRALAAGDCFVSLVVINTHATQNLRVLSKANAGEAATAGKLVPKNYGSIFIDLLGEGVSTISIRGPDGAATTGHAIAQFKRGGC